MDPGFSEGGANGNVHVATRPWQGGGCKREHGSFCHVCLTFVAKFAPFHSCQIFASLCIRGVSSLDAL